MTRSETERILTHIYEGSPCLPADRVESSIGYEGPQIWPPATLEGATPWPDFQR